MAENNTYLQYIHINRQNGIQQVAFKEQYEPYTIIKVPGLHLNKTHDGNNNVPPNIEKTCSCTDKTVAEILNRL